MAMNYATYRAVVNALFSLQAFDKLRKKPTKLVADTSNLQQETARSALKDLEKTGLIGKDPSAPDRRAIWVARKVTGKRSTSYKATQYLYDAANVQHLAQSDANAKALLKNINLTQLNMKEKTHRAIFNSVVKVLTQAGHKELPIYDFAARSFYWWLKTTSRKTADDVILKRRIP
jgi:DNA-binding MarR family transcriptional regulator